jgi:hypothetical protein
MVVRYIELRSENGEHLPFFMVTSHSFCTKGTPFFMPYEIQSGSHIHVPGLSNVLDDEFQLKRTPEDSSVRGVPLKFNFQHDLESLWWIMVWVLTRGVDDQECQKFASATFVNQLQPCQERLDALLGQPQTIFPSIVKGTLTHLFAMGCLLYTTYREREMENQLQNLETYSACYEMIGAAIKSFKSLDIKVRLQTITSNNRPHRTKRKRSDSPEA